MPIIVLHGIESTGKSTLAAWLAEALAAPLVPEYGRDYCLEHGTDCSEADLHAIAATQQAQIAAAACSGRMVIADTDWLMTRAWHRMMLGRDWAGPTYPMADLYLHLAADRPWIDDGLRVHADAAQRARFDELCRAELIQANARRVEIAGQWEARQAAALSAIAAI